MSRPARPTFLNPLQIQMPVGAWTSIGHRASGVLLAVTVPVGVFLLDLSLRNEQGFAQVSALFQHVAVKALAVVVLWALSHHLLAGIRHLLSDVNIGSPLRAARCSAWAVNAGGVGMALLAAGVLF
jgi:succinate dehydrogenase / fumarate reductase, cytochrome b subunit